MRRLEALLTGLVVAAALLRRGPPRPLPAGVDIGPGYERRDWNLTWVTLSGLALFAVLGVTLVVVTWFEVSTVRSGPVVSRDGELATRLAAAPAPPAPRLEFDEPSDLAAYRAATSERLQSYGWVDRTAGVVRIPIERAKELVTERGAR